ncbi:hypothetical protein XENOCAPTIV_009676, partial [Xenoophorus captivus]
MHYGLVIVGHSLGAGTAAILSFLLRPQYPTLHCYSYSPPGGLLRPFPFFTQCVYIIQGFHVVFYMPSEDAMEYSKEFVTSPVAPPNSRLWLHPSDLSIALSASTPLYPPGRIVHVVHNHPPES